MSAKFASWQTSGEFNMYTKRKIDNPENPSICDRFYLARTVLNKNGFESIISVSENTHIPKSKLEDLESTSEKKRGVSYLTVAELAKYYGVSMDFLVGNSNLKEISEIIPLFNNQPLSEAANMNLMNFMFFSRDKSAKKLLNEILEEQMFYEIVKKIALKLKEATWESRY